MYDQDPSSKIKRYSTRQTQLGAGFLQKELVGARRYDRIAGYFASSLFEIAGEALNSVERVRIVCNEDIAPEDVRIAQNRQAALLGQLNDNPSVDALRNRDRYRLLDEFLERHPDAIRVVPQSVCGFLHGKAGVIERADGSRIAFVGSMNESLNGWRDSYEILWSDESEEGCDWVQREFDFLWHHLDARLPESVVREIRRRARREEVLLAKLTDREIVPAALVESPMYREGLDLMPWQREFVIETLKHLEWYGRVRLLLADEVGLGKTLSMAVGMLAIILKGAADRSSYGKEERGANEPIVIFAPATLTLQWQVELMDRLGVPTARWDSTINAWLDRDGHVISPKGQVEMITRCPLRIGIVSTGLLERHTCARNQLDQVKKFETVIVDESHKARRERGLAGEGDENNLLKHIKRYAARTRHVIIGTATPMQTAVEDLWDQLDILQQNGCTFVLGSERSAWRTPAIGKRLLSGEEQPEDPDEAWRLLRVSFPPTSAIRGDGGFKNLAYRVHRALQIKPHEYHIPATVGLEDPRLRDEGIEEDLRELLTTKIEGASFFKRHNPIVRHVVYRRRKTLEEAKLLRPIGVRLHPDKDMIENSQKLRSLFSSVNGIRHGLATFTEFDLAYEAAKRFGRILAREKGRGALASNILHHRLCSSSYAGLMTARGILARQSVELEDEHNEGQVVGVSPEALIPLREIIELLERHLEDEPFADPKIEAVRFFLQEEGWADLGCIVFSQYYDTVDWLAGYVAGQLFPGEPVGLYAGAGRSRIYYGQGHSSIDREQIKAMIGKRELKLVLATDAACEGLNLQTLGTLINIDLPWNPIKLEQRIGRIKRVGQVREHVDMLNLLYQGTLDEKVYDRLSERMKNRFDIFGDLPDTISDNWIADEEAFLRDLDSQIIAKRNRNGFEQRYADALSRERMDQEAATDWRTCSKVLARNELDMILRSGWG